MKKSAMRVLYGLQRTPQTARDCKSFNRALRENTGESVMILLN